MPCPDCAQRDGVILALREAVAFLVGWVNCGQHHQDSSVPCNHVRCRFDEITKLLINTAPAAAEAITRIEAPLRARIKALQNDSLATQDAERDALRAQLTRQRAEVLDEVMRDFDMFCATDDISQESLEDRFIRRLREMKAQPPTSGSE